MGMNIDRNRAVDYKESMLSRFFSLVAGLIFLVSAHASAQGVVTIEIAKVQSAPTLSALVHDSAGNPLNGVSVVELSSDWKSSLRSTKTGPDGRFTLSGADNRIHHFQFSLPGFNPLRVRIRVSPERKDELQLQMWVST
jgi:hypothetical protein